MIVYKVLTAGNLSVFQRYKWPVPIDDKPTEWVIDRNEPVICARGFHGWLTLKKAQSEVTGTDKIYEMELSGTIVKDHEKAASNVARLIRLIPTPPPELVTKGYRNCVKCGKPHNSYKVPNSNIAPSWADLEDGHSYQGEDWEVFAARVTSAKELVEGALAEVRRAQQEHEPMPAGTSYHPVAPAFHSGGFRAWDKHPDKCGTCGLEKNLHLDTDRLEKLAKEFVSWDRWNFILYIDALRQGKSE